MATRCAHASETADLLCPNPPFEGTAEKRSDERWIKEFNPTADLLETSLQRAGFYSVNGLAANPGNDKVYFSSGNRVFTLDDDGAQPAPEATVDPVNEAEITIHSAKLTGTVKPNGPPGLRTSYRFEYSKDGVSWSAVAPNVNIGDGTGSGDPNNCPVENPHECKVEQTATGLETNRTYRVRIVAQKEFGAAEGVSGEREFTTLSAGPEVTTLYPQAIADTGARLTATLNAGNLQTTYHFELGKGKGPGGYETILPVPDAEASDGETHLAFEEAAGLEPNTPYHYRLVASNHCKKAEPTVECTAEGEDVTFTTRPPDQAPRPPACSNEAFRTDPNTALSSALPDCRAYEMTTPPLKATRNGGYPFGTEHFNALPAIASPGGGSLLYLVSIFALNGEAAFPFGGDVVRIDRAAGGWAPGSLLTQKPLGETENPELGRADPIASSADLAVQAFWTHALGDTIWTLIPGDGHFYTRRDGTGTGGFSKSPEESALFNDDGSRVAWQGTSLGLLGATPAADPSLQQSAGRAVYRQADPPEGGLDLVNGCTGTGAGATRVPGREGTGATSDKIAAQSCTEDTGAQASGAATRTAGSPTLTGLTESGPGVFAVGQEISGAGVPRGATIVAKGAGTLTLSANACGLAAGSAVLHPAPSTVLTEVSTTCGAFEAGQAITGAGIPPATTITAVEGDKLTISNSPTVGSSESKPVAAPGAGTYPSNDLSARARSVVSTLGASLGGATLATAMSNDGRRVFFQSPDPTAAGAPASTCTSATGSLTSCPPQLYVRSYDSSGNPMVRWISRPTVTQKQRIALLAPASFQGPRATGGSSTSPPPRRSRQTTPTRPASPRSVAGSASPASNDLYRYELPADPNEDPANGTLTRISAGPSTTADPNVGSARYISDDGQRAYFTTAKPIALPDETPPANGITGPGEGAGAENLYLFDATKSGAERWRFIARIATGCATSSKPPGPDFFYQGTGAGTEFNSGGFSCVRGTRSGDAIAFETNSRLVAEDTDNASDVYLYDARRDELTRVSTAQPGVPQADASSYPCPYGGACNAQLATDTHFFPCYAYESLFGWGGERNYNIAEDEHGAISVFFETRSRLAPQDTNSGQGTGDYWDVYEWREGKLSLISSGNTEDDAYYSGNSTDGRDVSFQTSQRIDPREISEHDVDIYDARVGGGFPYTPPPIPCDPLGHECPEEVQGPPSAPGPATPGFAGEGNVPRPKPCKKGRVRKHGRCVRKPSHHHKKHKGHHRHKHRGAGKGGRQMIRRATLALVASLALCAIVPAPALAEFGFLEVNAPGHREAHALPGTKAVWSGTCDLASAGTEHGGHPAEGTAAEERLALRPNCIDTGGVSIGTGWEPGDGPSWRLDPVAQAGAHPDASAAFWFEEESEGSFNLDGYVKDIVVRLPPGVVGSPTALPRCPAALVQFVPPKCPPETQVGVASVEFGLLGGRAYPIYNVEARDTITAEFAVGFAGNLFNVPISARGRTNGDYGVDTLTLLFPTYVETRGTAVTLWGVPWAAAHDRWRVPVGYLSPDTHQEIPEGGLPPADQARYQPAWGPIQPFFTNPTRCTASPLTVGFDVDSWENPGRTLGGESAWKTSPTSPTPTGRPITSNRRWSAAATSSTSTPRSRCTRP